MNLDSAIADLDGRSALGRVAELPADRYPVGDPGRAQQLLRAMPLHGSGVPDSVSDSYTAGDVQIRAASVRGLMHRHQATPRQDAYAVRAAADGSWVAAVVCDGVGSLPNSHYAAYHAAQAAVELISEGRHEGEMPDWREVFANSSRAIERGAVDAGISDRATTMTVVLINRDVAGGDVEVLTAWVGDSPAAVLLPDGGWTSATSAAGSTDGLVDNRTDALPRMQGPAGTAELRVPAGSLVLVMSDGFGTPLGDGDTDLGRAIADWWRAPVSQHVLAAHIDFERRTFVDDRTCVAVWLPISHG